MKTYEKLKDYLSFPREDTPYNGLYVEAPPEKVRFSGEGGDMRVPGRFKQGPILLGSSI